MMAFNSWRRWRLLVSCIALAALLPQRMLADDGVIDVGVAKVNITPDYPIRLNGFGFRRTESEGVTQPIWAKALVIGSDGEKPLILVTVDSCGIRMSMADEVAARLARKAGIERSRFAIAFSHSHTTPKVTGACETIFSTPIPPAHQERIDRYTKELTDAIESVALAALADRKPAELQWAVGNVGFAKNRRTEGGPVDHSLPMMVVRDPKDDSIRAVYVTYACHCVTLSNNKISGDWAGFAQHAIEMKHPGAIALVSIGCGSDSNPTSGVTGDNTAAAAEQGSQIAEEVERLLAGELKPIAGQVAATLNQIALPLNDPPSRSELDRVAKADDAPAAYNAKHQLQKIDRGESLQTEIAYPIQVWSFGDSLAMVFLGGEICVDYATRLKQEFDSSRLWLHGYSNDFGCYVPSERLLKEGGYGGGAEIVYFGLPNTLQPDLEQRIIDEVHRQIPPQFKATKAKDAGQARRQPLPLDQAVASIRVKPGFAVELMAAEPLVNDPVAIDFGPDGRLWVAEMPDYSRFADEDFPPTGSVRALTDSDGDGRYDEAVTFADKLRFPTDVKCWGAGVIVCDAPDVIYFEDRDGDGRADVRQVLLTGFATHNAQARVNSIQWGLDNWLYGSCGLFGGKITTAKGTVVELGGRDFRFRPDAGELQPVTGCTQQGRARDDWGNWFGCDSGSLVDHYPLADHYLARNPHVLPPPAEVRVPVGDDTDRLFPVGNPILFELSGPAGRPTSVCGLTIYRDDLLGDEYANNAFVAEPVNQLVHRRVLKRRGATFSGTRAADETQQEFLASTDPWFRPVQVKTGLDGCLWIVDMHRAVIEHQKFIPQESLRQLNVTAGRTEGRIYRVRPEGATPRKVERLDKLDANKLVAAMDSPNGPQRDLAHELLVQRKGREAAPALKKLVTSSDRPQVRLQALCALDGLEEVDEDLILHALADANSEVRSHAIRLAEPFFGDSTAIVDAVLKLTEDRDPQVRLQLAYSLGALDHDRAMSALSQIVREDRDDSYIVAAVWSSVTRKNVGNVVRALLEERKGDLPIRLAESAITMTLKLGSDEDIAAAAAALASSPDNAEWVFAASANLLERLGSSGERSIDVQRVRGELAPLIEKSCDLVTDGDVDDRKRMAAMRLLMVSSAEPAESLPVLARLLGPGNPPAVRDAAVKMVASIDSEAAGDTLLEQWSGYTPGTRAIAFDAILGREQLLNVLMDKLASGALQPTEIDALQRQRLLTHAEQAIRERAKTLLTSDVTSDRNELIERYLEAASGHDADAHQGRQLFARHCAGCHHVDGQGYHVGPDLAALTNRTPKALIESILDPNRAIDERYQYYTAVTLDGVAHAGIIDAETSTSITLAEQEGKTHTILRSELEILQNSGKSLMPEGFDRDLRPSDVANLVAYLARAGRPPKQVSGNEPVVVTPDFDGALWLLASNGKIYGHEITFESPHQNIGYWHDGADHVTWDITVDRPGEYEVWLHWACADASAGNTCIIEGGKEPLRHKVETTGGYDRYKTTVIGGISLAAGHQRIVIRPDGPLQQRNLMDLRGIYLTPAGSSSDLAALGMAPSRKNDSAAAISALVSKWQESKVNRRKFIPAVWNQAIAAGRRNEPNEILRVLHRSLPQEDQPLVEWQAVVLGGGIVNGISQSGDWPRERLASLLISVPEMQKQWQRLIELAARMADDASFVDGTRYDALRILGTASYEEAGEQILRYLRSSDNPELQLGAVSALSDIDDERAAAALLSSLKDLPESIRSVAVEGLLRTDERTSALTEAIENGNVPKTWLTEEQVHKIETASNHRRN